MTARTSAPTVNVEGLPASLRPRRQWVGWKFEQRGELLTKPPYQVDGLTYAESDDPGTWNTFEAVIDAYRAGTVKGPGYALAQGGGVAYVDLDHCRDALTGDIAPWAKRIIGVFDGTHIEVSPSKCGVKILGFGRLPDNPRHVYNVPGAHPKAKVELYDCKKYTTLTGERLPESGDDLADIQDALDRLYAELFPAKAGAKQASNGHRSTGRLDDEEVIRLCRDAKNGPNFRRLWAGDTSQHDKDDSKADSALLSIIAFYTQDEAQLDRLFRRSGLMRDKWNRDDYRKRTLEFVLSQVDEKYEPAGG